MGVISGGHVHSVCTLKLKQKTLNPGRDTIGKHFFSYILTTNPP